MRTLTALAPLIEAHTRRLPLMHKDQASQLMCLTLVFSNLLQVMFSAFLYVKKDDRMLWCLTTYAH